MNNKKLPEISRDVLALAALNGAVIVVGAVQVDGVQILLPPTQNHDWELVRTWEMSQVGHQVYVPTSVTRGAWRLKDPKAVAEEPLAEES